MTTVEQLTQVFYDNFIAYFRSHMAHVNVTGRNFSEDHELLGGVYEDLQGQIDMIAELIRSLDEFAPNSLDEVMANSTIMPSPIFGSADELLGEVLADLEQLKGCYEDLMSVADNEGHLEISNYAQDRVLALAKQIWMFKSTLS